MSIASWFEAFLDGMVGSSSHRRRSVWAVGGEPGAGLRAVQDLESRCMLSSGSLLTSGPLMQDSEVSQSTVTDLSQSLTVESDSAQGYVVQKTWSWPSEDLFDEGAGAVWGTIADDGSPGVTIGAEYGVAAWDTGGGDFGVGASPVLDDGAMGGFYGVGDLPYHDPGAVVGAGDYGAGDYGAGDYGAGDYGAGDLPSPDGGIPGGDSFGVGDLPAVGDIPAVEDNGDWGGDLFGVGDIPLPDIQGDMGGGWGQGTDGSPSVDGPSGDGPGGDSNSGDEVVVLVNLDSLDAEFLEGPYRNEGRDRAKLTISKRILNEQRGQSPVTVTLRFSGTATLSEDYFVTDWLGKVLMAKGNTVDVTLSGQGEIFNFFLVSRMDGEFEEPETVIITPVSARYHGMEGTRANVSSGKEPLKSKLLDKTGNLILADLNEVDEDRTGRVILRNDDDDNGNEIRDLDEPKKLFADDDLVKMTVKPLLNNPHDHSFVLLGNMIYQSVSYFVVTYDAASVAVYRESSGDRIQSGETRLSSKSVTELLVEGVRAGAGRISLTWVVRANLGDGVESGVLYQHTVDTVRYTVWAADLNIDSDNNNALSLPDGSWWEEVLEDHEYGIGKLIYPRPIPPSGEFQTYSYTPFKVTVSPVDHADNVGIRLIFRNHGESGHIRIWSPRAATGTLNYQSISYGGHQLYPGEIYSLSELERRTTFLIQAESAKNGHSVMAGVDFFGKPNDRIRLEVFQRSAPDSKWELIQGLTDEIKYMVTDYYDAFYPNLQYNRSARHWQSGSVHTGQVLRDSLASEAVYDALDLPQFALQKLTLRQMTALGINYTHAKKIRDSWNPNSDGFRAAVYRDYLSDFGRGYILAFAGTQLEMQDLLTDFYQAIGVEGSVYAVKAESQYHLAMEMGQSIGALMRASNLELRFTGHSLGGGLASAATLAANASQIPATTFNAAGIHRNTLMKRSGLFNRVTNEEIYEGSLRQLNRELGGVGIISMFVMEFDPLTMLQEKIRLSIPGVTLPYAIGRRIELKGPFDALLHNDVLLLKEEIERIMAGAGGLYGKVEAVRQLIFGSPRYAKTIYKTLPHHTIRFVHYGLMVSQFFMTRVRVWDIFGYKNP